MHSKNDILISVRPQHVAAMLSGEKTVELRRRPVRAPIGTTVWIYETVPAGRLRIVAQLAAIEESSPDSLWRRHRSRVGITRDAFSSYFEGSERACALVLREVRPLSRPPKLPELRSALGEFVAPQFYRKLAQDGPELALYRKYSAVKGRKGRDGKLVAKKR